MEIEGDIAKRVLEKRTMDTVIADFKNRMDFVNQKRDEVWGGGEDDWEPGEHFNGISILTTANPFTECPIRRADGVRRDYKIWEGYDRCETFRGSGSVCYVFEVVETATYGYDIGVGNF